MPPATDSGATSGLPVIQVVLLAIIGAMVLYTLMRRRRGEIGPFAVVAWLLVWTAGGLAVAFPHCATRVAQTIGVGRGADLATYVSIVTLFYVVFRLLMRIERLNRDVTDLVRAHAIEQRIAAEVSATAPPAAGGAAPSPAGNAP